MVSYFQQILTETEDNFSDPTYGRSFGNWVKCRKIGDLSVQWQMY